MFDFVAICTLVACGNYITTKENVTPITITLQVMYNLDHATCMHFHYPLDLALSTCL
jgi:hypothetical protein